MNKDKLYLINKIHCAHQTELSFDNFDYTEPSVFAEHIIATITNLVSTYEEYDFSNKEYQIFVRINSDKSIYTAYNLESNILDSNTISEISEDMIEFYEDWRNFANKPAKFSIKIGSYTKVYDGFDIESNEKYKITRKHTNRNSNVFINFKKI